MGVLAVTHGGSRDFVHWSDLDNDEGLGSLIDDCQAATLRVIHYQPQGDVVITNKTI